jgi:hypothetical protein
MPMVKHGPDLNIFQRSTRDGITVRAKKLKKGKGIKVKAFVSGMHYNEKGGDETITVEIGKSINPQRFSMKVPRGMGVQLMSKGLDVILAIRDDEDDD